MRRPIFAALVLFLSAHAHADPQEHKLDYCVVKGRVPIDRFIEIATDCPSHIIQADALLINDKHPDTFTERIGNGGLIQIEGTKARDDDRDNGDLMYKIQIAGLRKAGNDYRASGFYAYYPAGLYQGFRTGSIEAETIRSKREACGVQIAVRARFDAYGRTPFTEDTPDGRAFRIRAARECYGLMDTATMCRIWLTAAATVKERLDDTTKNPRVCLR